MTEHEKRIREALEAGPTEGPWFAEEKFNVEPHEGTHWIRSELGVLGYWRGHKEHHTDSNWVLNQPDARLIAACNPAAIRALLADLDAVRVKAARYDWLRDEAVLFGHDDSRPSAWAVVGTGYEDCNPIQGSELDATIDDALKGASHE